MYPIKMRDMAKNEVIIRMRVVTNRFARYLLVFYADRVIKNHTSDNLILYGVKVPLCVN